MTVKQDTLPNGFRIVTEYMPGLQSAALLVLSPERPPLDLRIDYSDDPLPALRTLCLRAHRSPYYDWLTEVPVLKDRHRAVLPDAS